MFVPCLIMCSCYNQFRLPSLHATVSNSIIDTKTKCLDFTLEVNNVCGKDIILQEWDSGISKRKNEFSPITSPKLTSLINSSKSYTCDPNADESFAHREIFYLHAIRGDISFMPDHPQSYYESRKDVLLMANRSIKIKCSIPIEKISAGEICIKLTGAKNPFQCYFEVARKNDKEWKVKVVRSKSVPVSRIK